MLLQRSAASDPVVFTVERRENFRLLNPTSGRGTGDKNTKTPCCSMFALHLNQVCADNKWLLSVVMHQKPHTGEIESFSDIAANDTLLNLPENYRKEGGGR